MTLYYILMEFCWEGNLRNFFDKYINNDILIEENKICNIIKQICIGIKEIQYYNIFCLKIIYKNKTLSKTIFKN